MHAAFSAGARLFIVVAYECNVDDLCGVGHYERRQLSCRMEQSQVPGTITFTDRESVSARIMTL